MLKSLAIGLFVFAVTFGVAESSAHAQEAITTPGNQADGNVAGTIGLGLLGAELGLILTPLVGLHDQTWAWIVFPAVGAAGGALAGGFAFDPGSPGLSATIPLLGAGIALVIPSIVGALAIKSKRENKALEEVPTAGLFHLRGRKGSLHVPNVGTAPVYSQTEQQRYGLPQRSSLRVALVSGQF